MRNVKCNLCGGDDYTVVFPKGYAQLHRIVRCNRCGLMYANPQERLDCDVYSAPREPYDPERENARQYFQKQVTQLPDNLAALRVLNCLRPARGRLLEIGSFAGIFLDRIRRDGWEAVGLDPDRAVSDYARTRYGLRVLDGVLPHPELRAEEFDAVVMLHVIEHMPDPAESLREIRRLLKPGGVLVIETPRFDSLSFRILGHRERSIQNCPGHIYFYTRQTLRQLLERNGFEVIRLDLVGRTLTLERFLDNVGLVSRNGWVRGCVSRTSRALRLDRVRFHVNIRDMQRVYARRAPAQQ